MIYQDSGHNQLQYSFSFHLIYIFDYFTKITLFQYFYEWYIYNGILMIYRI